MLYITLNKVCEKIAITHTHAHTHARTHARTHTLNYLKSIVIERYPFISIFAAVASSSIDFKHFAMVIIKF